MRAPALSRGPADRVGSLLDDLEAIQNALEVGPGEGRVRDVDDVRLARRVDDEQAGLREWAVGFLRRARVGDVETELPHLIGCQAIADRKVPALFGGFARGLLLRVAGNRDDVGPAGAELIVEPVQALQVAPANRTMLAAVDHHHLPYAGIADRDLAAANLGNGHRRHCTARL